MSYSLRVVPRDSHVQALTRFDNDIRRAFAAAVGVHLDDDAWKRAQCPVSFAGLGLRSVVEFSDAAYIASVASNMNLAHAIDNSFKADDDATCGQIRSAIRRVNEKLPECAHVKSSLEETPPQKALCAKLERGVIDNVLLSPHTPVALKAHTQLMSARGSGAWLHAMPCRESCTLLDAPLFRIAILRRLRMPLMSSPSHCPACGMGLDIWADHALVCSCKGDRTIRHNALRNCTFRFARSSGANPQKEKPGLLPPRPDAECIKEKSHSSGRRPADIWMPRWCDGGPAALDFAVTSGMRGAALHRSAIDHSATVVDYEASKRNYLSTAAQCEQQGLQFLPIVIEAHGGTWGPTAKQAFKALCREYANSNSVETSAACSDFAQRISIALERENARAILRRLTQLGGSQEEGCNSAAWLDDPVDADGDAWVGYALDTGGSIFVFAACSPHYTKSACIAR